MLCQFLLYSEVTEPRIYIYPLFLGFPSYLGHHRAFNRVLCPYSKFSLVIYFIHSINSLCVCVCVCVLSCVQLFVTPWTVAHQTPLSMEFSFQPRDRTCVSLHQQVDSLSLSHWGRPDCYRLSPKNTGGNQMVLLCLLR